MKEVKLETLKFKIDVAGKKEDIELKEEDLVFQASRYKKGGPQKGFSWTDMKVHHRIDTALRASEKDHILKLDDSDFDKILEGLKETEWNNASKEMVQVVVGLVEKFQKVNEKETKSESNK